MASGGSGLSNSHGERGIDDEVASDEVPDGDEDMTPALHNLEGRGIKVEVKKVVAKPGYSYVVVDRDLGKGDRRCDGKFMSDFFSVTETLGSSCNEVRQSQRVHLKRTHAETMFRVKEITSGLSQNVPVDEVVGDICIEEHEPTLYVNLNVHDETERSECLWNADEETFVVHDEIDVFNIKKFGRGLRRPDAGIRCAGRQGTTRLVWLHEFFVVIEGRKHKSNWAIYQALLFLVGSDVPECRVTDSMTAETRRDIWVLEVRHVPSQDVRDFCTTSSRGYLFHNECHDGDARTALLGTCPELVRVENDLKWFNVHAISTDVPRVVHPDDIRTRKVHVVGRKQHFVCGVTAVEDTVKKTFTLSQLPRTEFCMYPEERLGMELNSASMMWEHVEDIFKRIRGCMSSGRQGTSSATFSMPLLGTVYDFWKVITFTQNMFKLSANASVLTWQELIGTPDRLRRSRGVHKDRRCDANFAYQQILGDVYREVLDYTSRYVSFYFHISFILPGDTAVALVLS